ncbi:MAG TPA: aminoglycoside phosphotransferase [Dermatophilaceae bacterium]
MQELEELLPSWMVRQRWYAGKGRVPLLRRIGGLRFQDPAGEVDVDVHLMLDESGQSPTIYQVPLTYRSARLAGADHALVATVEPNSHGRHAVRYVYDAPHDPVFATALLQLMLGEGTTTPGEGAASDEPSSGMASGMAPGSAIGRGHRVSTAIPGQVIASHVLKGEQSNTSIILELVDTRGAPANPLICKLFRVLHHGDNPDVAVQSALAAAGSTHVPRSVGYVVGEWPDTSAPDGMARGHLACAQEFFPDVEDAWRVALAAVAADEDFSEQARSLGQTTAKVHATLAHAMTTVTASDEDIAALSRSMRARHASAVSEVPALAAYDSMVHASIERVSSVKWPTLQRIHGDYHLGQVLEVPHRGWVLVDFEGEPLRPLTERTHPDLALRDVAGMLRSFDYAAGSWEQMHPGRSARGWADRARIAFLEGYAKESGRDPREDAVLLDALELDKALYEVVYEARNRPTWLTIPTTAIDRLFAGRRSDLRL